MFKFREMQIPLTSLFNYKPNEKHPIYILPTSKSIEHRIYFKRSFTL
jgi:hypothetical protein